MWVGYLEDLPEYPTQGESIGEVKETQVITVEISRTVKFRASVKSPNYPSHGLDRPDS
jgi:hypothetical protein